MKKECCHGKRKGRRVDKKEIPRRHERDQSRASKPSILGKA